jgi:hypothetical protein
MNTISCIKLLKLPYIKGKVASVPKSHGMNTKRKRRWKAPCISRFGIILWKVISFTLQPTCPQYPRNRRLSGPHSQSGRCGKEKIPVHGRSRYLVVKHIARAMLAHLYLTKYMESDLRLYKALRVLLIGFAINEKKVQRGKQCRNHVYSRLEYTFVCFLTVDLIKKTITSWLAVIAQSV